jgi:hypothetical protein
MAKKKSSTSNGESISGYFRKVFKENPSWLGERSNDLLIARWKKDHPGTTDVPEKVRQGLANIKSVLRKANRKKPGRPKKDSLATGTGVTQAVPVVRKVKGLELLEEHIDDCLTLARNLDEGRLATVIAMLRRARNEVVWMQGQPE